MTTLALDWGEANIGVAVSDGDGVVATPLAVFRLKDIKQNPAQFLELFQKWQVQLIVCGIPLAADGAENDKSMATKKAVESFVKSLLKENLQSSVRSVLESIRYYPEYLSTKQSNMGLSKKQKHELGDAYAAAHILQAFLDWQRTGI